MEDGTIATSNTSMAVHPASAPRELTAASVGKIDAVQGLRAVAVLLVVLDSLDCRGRIPFDPKTRHILFSQELRRLWSRHFFCHQWLYRFFGRHSGNCQGSILRTQTFLSRRFTRIFPLYWILTIVIVLEAQFGRYPIQWHQVPSIQPCSSCRDGSIPFRRSSCRSDGAFCLRFILPGAGRLDARVASPPDPQHHGISYRHGGSRRNRRHPPPAAGDLVKSGCIRIFLRLCHRASGYAHRSQYSRIHPRAILPTAHLARTVGPWLVALGAIALAATIFTGYGNASEASSILGRHGWLAARDCLGRSVCPAGAGGCAVASGHAIHTGQITRIYGDASYSIYLCTNPARSMVEHFWRFFGHWGGDAGVLLCLLASLAVGILCYLAVERPLMRFFHNWYKQLPFSTDSERAASPATPQNSR